MILDPNELHALLNNSLTLDFVEITLTQNVENQPISYSGSGSVSQDVNGILQLKMTHVYKDEHEIKKEMSRFNRLSSLTPGKIIGNEVYFSFKGKDIRGREWTSDSILITDGIVNFPPQVGKVIKTSLRLIRNISERSAEGNANLFVTAYIPGDYELPYNKFVKTETTSSLEVCELKIGKLIYFLKKQNNNLEISQSHSSDKNFDRKYRLFLEGAGIGIGKVLRPTYYITGSEKTYTAELHSIKDKNRNHSLPPPIPSRHQFEVDNLQRFVARYIEVLHKPYSSYYLFWYRILSSSSDLYENQILVITTSIEGILKDWYSEYMQGDVTLIEEIRACSKEIDKLKTSDRVKSKILSHLGQAKSKTVKNALYKLLDDKCISQDMIDTWGKARNSATHADTLEAGDKQFQTLLDNSYKCLSLFYSLLLNTIKYEGPILDYTASGWPERHSRRHSGELSAAKVSSG